MDDVWLWSILLASRSLDDDQAMAALISVAGAAPEQDALYEQLWRAKAIREANRRLDHWAHQGLSAESVLGPVHDRLRAAIAEDDQWRQQAIAPMKEALQTAAEVGVGVMKGLALAHHYPDPMSRHLGDVDLHCADWATVVEFCRRATATGWVWDVAEYPWIKWEGDVVYGQLSLVTPDNVDPVARVDLHVGPYSIGPNGRVWISRWTDGTALGVPVRMLDQTELAVILVAHAANDGFLSAKDLNDFAVLQDHGQLNLVALREASIGFGCDRVLEQIRGTVAALRDLAAPTPDPSAVRMLMTRATDGPLSLRPPTGRARALLAARLAYRIGRLDGDSIVAGMRTARSSYRYYTADLSVRGGRPCITLERRWRRPDVCWRLVPPEAWPVLPPTVNQAGDVVTEPLETGMSRHTRGAGVAVTIDSHVFVPTVWGQINPDSVSLGTQLLRASAADESAQRDA